MTNVNEVSPPGWGHTKAEKEKREIEKIEEKKKILEKTEEKEIMEDGEIMKMANPEDEGIEEETIAPKEI